MENLINLEKKINSELTTKINSSRVKHNQIYLSIDSNDIIDVILFMKTNENTIARQFQEKDPGVILASSSMISAVELEESYDYETLEKNLEKVAESLSMIARNSNMSLQALLVLDEEGIVKDVLPSKPVSSAKNFSIVV